MSRWIPTKHIVGRKILTDEETVVLVTEYLITGSDSLRDQLIIGHVQLVTGLASSFMSQYPTVGDEFFDAGLVALVVAVSRFPLINRDNNIGPYIRSCVRNSMLDLLRAKKILQVSEERLEKVPNRETVCFIDFLDACTPDEERLIDLLCTGYTVSEAADELKCSKSHIYSVIIPSIERKISNGC